MMEKASQQRMRSRLFEELVLRSWWVILFLFLCTFSYEQALFYKDKAKKNLLSELHSLKEEKKKSQNLQDDLQLQIESMEDDAWIEMVLMKGLGLVPEGAIKVHFQHPH